jgi:hypothetical protein
MICTLKRFTSSECCVISIVTSHQEQPRREAKARALSRWLRVTRKWLRDWDRIPVCSTPEGVMVQCDLARISRLGIVLLSNQPSSMAKDPKTWFTSC